ncbi:MAG: hypothetical protein DRJ97_08140 [Thermoprotei archaeon]|nr:MAG: hypothetical protein DRJ97_08140 [Thermoprotei archaeon]
MAGLKEVARALLPPYNALLIYLSLVHPSTVEALPALATIMEAWEGLVAHAASMTLLAAIYVAAGLSYAASRIAASSTGALIEGLQALVPWRTACPLDLAADLAGATVGLALAWALLARRGWASERR